MQYELWARSKETKVYEFIDSFTNVNEKWSKMDLIDTDLYYEVMIVQTDFKSMPRLETYIDLDKKPKSLVKRKGK